MSFPFRQDRNILWYHERGLPATPAIVPARTRLAYVPIPKVACTSIKIAFYEIREGKPYEGHFDGIHKEFRYSAVDFKAFIEDKEYFKFAVIRDPVDRFVSGFNSRSLIYGEFGKPWFEKHAPEMISYFAANRLNFDPDINMFALRIREYLGASRQINHHFVPQSWFLSNAPHEFDRIYDFPELQKLEEDLSERVRREVRFPHAQESRGVRNGASVKDLTPKAMAALTQYYVQDYQGLAPYWR